MISRFFIDRPIFASVLSILITLTGAISLLFLPIAQYPQITPPSVQVSITYPGASAQVVADTVGAPVEQQVNGVEGMFYMSSQSGNDGSYGLTVTFDVDTDLNTALVMVQNRVALAMPQLPTEVQLQGITIRKRTPDILQVVSFFSPDGRYDDLYLSNFATIHVRDELFRVDGVSDINYLGERDYSIRVWLDPQKLAALNVTAGEVAQAVRSQNIEAAAGQVSPPPGGGAQPYELPLDTLGRLSSPEQFGDIIVKVGPGPSRQTTTASAGVAVTSASPTSGGASPPASGMSPFGSGGGNQGSGAVPTPAGALLQPAGTGAGTGLVRPSPQPGQGGANTTGGANSSGGAGSPSTAGTPTGSSSTQGTSGTQGGSSSSGQYPSGMGASAAGNGQSGTSPQPRIYGRPVTNAAGLTVQPVPIAAIPAGGGGPLAPAPAAPSPGVVRLRDVARLELGAQNYNQSASFDGRPSVGLGIHQLPGTNALDVADRVRQKMEELKQSFPEGVDYEIAYDITPFIRESVLDVVWTLVEAVGLVALVVLVFLQNWRSALIPLVAVPVAVVGTFAVMAALGFSLNNISLFGLVLAIGIVVDDAIVVVENVERWLEHGEEPREAARKAMDEVTGPVIAVALVLCAVFIPCAFIGGITGRFFRQFAVTIAASTVISAFNSLTLSPALAAILLKPRGARPDPLTRSLDFALGWFFRLFNRAFGAGTSAYVWVVDKLLRGGLLALPAYAALVALTWWVFARAPTGFVPDQDQGRLIVSIQLPDSASLQRSQESLALVERITRETPGVAHTATVAGMSLVLGANSSNFATMFVILDPFAQRRDPSRSDRAVLGHILEESGKRLGDGLVTGFRAPPIPGLSVTGGFKLMVEDHADAGPVALEKQTDALIARLKSSPGVAAAFTQYRSRTPQLFADVDRTKVESLGVSLGDVNEALRVFLGSSYVNSFNEFGRYWQVTLQSEGRYRSRVGDVNLIQVRNRYGGMVPLGTLVNLREINGPVMALRYNLYPAAPVTGGTAPGASSGEVIAAARELARQVLPRTMSTEWTELYYIQIKAGNTAIDVFLLAVVFVFLALAALYESWAMPLAVILVVPLCLLCSVAGVLFRGGAVDIFVQIGLVVLVGLACKNSILIVEFAQQLRLEGKPLREATLEACRLRLRPILMTSFAFILGVVPLVTATGAGAEMRRSLGTAVFSGMLGVTVFGVFVTPVFFYLIGLAGDRPLFASSRVLWAGSVLLGGLAGLAFGALLWDVGVVPLPWALGIGAGLGILAAVLGRSTFRGLLPQARRHAGQPGGGRHP